ncbi:metal-sensing transcriptional repressor [Paraburkholderia humisilvae]|uniref:metal-sensing transcriptional repressor n=1 Tax=Paraburkholderia humisilvae TaxID=627669 RepID=UPI0015824FA3
MSKITTHTSHADVTLRPQRADGHLRKVVTMIKTDRTCVELVLQLFGIEKPITIAKRALIHDQADHRLEVQAATGVESARTCSRNSRRSAKSYRPHNGSSY